MKARIGKPVLQVCVCCDNYLHTSLAVQFCNLLNVSSSQSCHLAVASYLMTVDSNIIGTPHFTYFSECATLIVVFAGGLYVECFQDLNTDNSTVDC